MARPSGRRPDEMRSVTIEPGYSRHAEGSCLITVGHTKVLCTASLGEGVPGWMKGLGRGWVTAEYGMLPRATGERMRREAKSGGQSGRTQEIQRLIGRSLRAVVDLDALGEHQIVIDCDVLQADGGTRCAAITGGWVALRQCIDWMLARKMIERDPIRDQVAAVSCGVWGGEVILDLEYVEDSEAETDANFVITGSGGLVEIQATAEAHPFSEAQFLEMLALARKGVAELVAAQKAALEKAGGSKGTVD